MATRTKRTRILAALLCALLVALMLPTAGWLCRGGQDRISEKYGQRRKRRLYSGQGGADAG